MRERPTAEDIRAHRDVAMCGLHEAKEVLLSGWRRDCLRDLRSKASELHTVEQCRDVIVDMIEFLQEIDKCS